MTGDKTQKKHAGMAPNWEAGKSGNPAGRPKGSRNKLGEDFIRALAEDFKAHGVDALQKMRGSKPNEYIRVIASLLPKELNIAAGSPFDDLSDTEVRDLYDAARSVAVNRAGDEQEEREGESGSIH